MIRNNLPMLLGAKRMKMIDLCKITGISHSKIGRIYNENITLISLDTIDKICRALNCNTQELFEYIRDEDAPGS